MNAILFERLSLGINRYALAETAGIDPDRLQRAEDGVEPLAEADEAARVAALAQIVKERLARFAENIAAKHEPQPAATEEGGESGPVSGGG